MTPETNKIHQGDVLEVIKTWPDGFVQTCVTSPPYWGLRDYGVDGQLGLEKTPEEFVAKMVEVFREVRRVLRDDGTLWLNLGDSFCSSGRGGYDRVRAGISKNGGNCASDFHAAPNRMSLPGIKNKDLVGIPWMCAFSLRSDGWYLRSDIIWAKKNCMPESVTDRPTRSHEYIFLMTKSPRYYYDAEAIKEPAIYFDDDRKARALDSHKSAPTEKINGIRPLYKDARAKEEQYGAMRNKRSVWSVATHPYSESHFATFPEKLIEPCVLAGAPSGGLVLDPFMGAGTTALVASKLNRKFIGIELNPKYIEMAEKRIAPELAQGKFA